MITLRWAVAFVALGLAASAEASSAAVYDYTILDVPGAGSTQPIVINDSGVVAGNFYDGSGQHGFIWSGGTYTVLDVPGAAGTQVYSINTLGAVVGSFNDRIGTHGFIESGGSYTILDVPGASFTSLAGINASGTVAGTFGDAQGNHGFIESGGSYTVVPASSNNTELVGINASAVVAGSFDGFAALEYSGGPYFAPFVASGALATIARGINDSGIIVGYFNKFSIYQEYGFIWSGMGNEYTTLTAPGSTFTEPTSINNAGTIAGFFFNGSRDVGFVESGGTYSVLDPSGGADHTFAESINASGAVTGFFGNHGFIATSAVPEPSVWMTLILGMTGVGAVARNRRKRAVVAG